MATKVTASPEIPCLFTSDNGGTHGTTSSAGRKGNVHRRWNSGSPDCLLAGVILANTVTKRMVHGIDFYPTLIELAGTMDSAEKNHPLDGESLPGF